MSEDKAVVTVGARVEVLASGRTGVVERMDRKAAYLKMEDGAEEIESYPFGRVDVREREVVATERPAKAVGEIWKEGRAHKIQFADGTATAHTKWEADLWAKAAKNEADTPEEAREIVAKAREGHSR